MAHKRQCTSDGASEVVTRKEMCDLLEEQNKSLLEQLGITIIKNSGETLEKLEAKFGGRLSTVEEQLQCVKDELAAAKATTAAHNELLEQLKIGHEYQKSVIEQFATQDFGPPLDDNWERKARTNVLAVGVSGLIAKSKLVEQLGSWTAKFPCEPSQYQWSGPEFGRNFELTFLGPPKDAAETARKANLTLKKGDGSWDKLQVKDSTDNVSDTFISKDLCDKYRRENTLVKRLLKIIKSTVADPDHYEFKWRTRAISYKNSPCVKIPANSFADFEILWADSFDLADFPKTAILAEFNKATGSEAGETWST